MLVVVWRARNTKRDIVRRGEREWGRKITNGWTQSVNERKKSIARFHAGQVAVGCVVKVTEELWGLVVQADEWAAVEWPHATHTALLLSSLTEPVAHTFYYYINTSSLHASRSLPCQGQKWAQMLTQAWLCLAEIWNLINKGIWLFLLHKDANLGKGWKLL